MCIYIYVSTYKYMILHNNIYCVIYNSYLEIMVLHCYHHENSPSIRHGSLLERAVPVESFQCEKIPHAGDHSPGANFLAAREMVAKKKRSCNTTDG